MKVLAIAVLLLTAIIIALFIWCIELDKDVSDLYKRIGEMRINMMNDNIATITNIRAIKLDIDKLKKRTVKIRKPK